MTDGTAGEQAREGYRVRLLADAPATTDEFEARAHARVASAIAQLIANEDGGKVIGLEGQWGSGKSTVVRLLTDELGKLATERETRILVFDAWAHQGDPLRRTFLETVIGELETAQWLGAESAKRASDELTGRTSRVKTTSSSTLSLEGKLAAAATVLIALGAALFANHFSHLHRPFIALGAVLLVAPLLLVLGLWMAKHVGSRLWPRLATLNPSSFFARDQSTETTTEGVQSSDPTSVEFEQIFSRVLSDSVTEARCLVLVLDNLDRVDATDARQVLATMQTFDVDSTHAREWGPRVWILIPYDAEGLERLWAASGGNSEDQPEPQLSMASAFLDKLFHVRFAAPPLVLSDWRRYALRLLQEALPDEENATLEAVVRLRGLYPGAVPEWAVAAEAPTPRQLKQFANQVGSICLQRDDVPLAHVAYYVLLRRDSSDLPRALLDGTLPHAKLAHLFEASVREDLAALHFGATQLLAQQLLLGPALEEAFAAGDPSRLENLAERPGFIDALERADFEARAANGGIELTRAVAVLDRSGALGVETVRQWASAVLDPLAAHTQTWHVQGRDSGAGLAFLLNRASGADDQRLTEFLRRVAPAPVEGDTEGRGYLEGVAGLVDELDVLGRSGGDVRVTLSVPSATVVDSLDFLRSQVERANAHRVLDVDTDPAELATALVEAAAAGRIEASANAVELLGRKAGRIDATELASQTTEWLRSNEPASEEQLALLLDWLDRARRAADAEDTLAAPSDDGTLLHLVYVATANGWYPEAAAASMLHLVVRPELPEPPAHSRQSTSGIATLRQALTGLSPSELLRRSLSGCNSTAAKHSFSLRGFAKGPARRRGRISSSVRWRNPTRSLPRRDSCFKIGRTSGACLTANTS